MKGHCGMKEDQNNTIQVEKTKKPKPVMVTIRMSEEEYNRIMSLAQEANTSLNSYFKLKALGYNHDTIARWYKDKPIRGRKPSVKTNKTNGTVDQHSTSSGGASEDRSESSQA